MPMDNGSKSSSSGSRLPTALLVIFIIVVIGMVAEAYYNRRDYVGLVRSWLARANLRGKAGAEMTTNFKRLPVQDDLKL